MEKRRAILSKIATNDKHGENSPYFDGWKAYDRNPFHPTKNPKGVIQMGLAENPLCIDLIRDWVERNPKASICTTEGVWNFQDIAMYQDYNGLKEFREAIAMFMGRVRENRVTFDPDRVVMSGGATGANETVMFCLANPVDAFLVPSPYYPAFVRDLGWRTGVKIIAVDCDSSNNFQITKEALEMAYVKAQKDGINVQGVLIANPSNPLGTILDEETLTMLVHFINDKNIHLVVDEIYAATVFTDPTFISVAEVIKDKEYINSDLIHIVYSLSKDMGLPGFRVGIVYSFNDQVVRCARRMSSFGLVSSQTQHLLASMLSDEDFVNNFLGTCKIRLKERHSKFTKPLEEIGITCLKSNAGLFVWMDLRHLLEEPTFDGEMKLWRMIVDDVKLNVSPGSSFRCVEPGWFRVCFANMDEETLGVALKRIRGFVLKGEELDTNQEVVATTPTTSALKKDNKRGFKKNLRLSFSSLMYEEGINSPCMLSPHSPLVKART